MWVRDFCSLMGINKTRLHSKVTFQSIIPKLHSEVAFQSCFPKLVGRKLIGRLLIGRMLKEDVVEKGCWWKKKKEDVDGGC